MPAPTDLKPRRRPSERPSFGRSTERCAREPGRCRHGPSHYRLGARVRPGRPSAAAEQADAEPPPAAERLPAGSTAICSTSRGGSPPTAPPDQFSSWLADRARLLSEGTAPLLDRARRPLTSSERRPRRAGHSPPQRALLSARRVPPRRRRHPSVGSMGGVARRAGRVLLWVFIGLVLICGLGDILVGG
jgi:hypothetical protein